MLVSLSLVNLQRVKVNLPTATLATTEALQGFVHLPVDQAGLVLLERNPVGAHELVAGDERIKPSAAQLQTLANERDDVVKQFNELAIRHNQLVKD